MNDMVGLVAEFKDEVKLRRGKIKDVLIERGMCFAIIAYKVVLGDGWEGFGLATVKLHVSQFKLIRE